MRRNEWRAALVTLQQHERLVAEIAEMEAGYKNAAELVLTYHGKNERLEAVVEAAWRAVEQRPDHSKHMTALYDALAALDSAAPSESLSRSDHIERLEAVVKAARDLLRYAGIKHPGADNVIVSRERVHTLANALAALDTAAPETPPDVPPSNPSDGYG